jgi:hypothetical protein
MRRETYEPTPARALDASSSRVELLLEVVNRTPALTDGSPERAVTDHAAVAPALGSRGREVPPKERMIDVAYGHKRVSDIGWTDKIKRGVGVDQRGPANDREDKRSTRMQMYYVPPPLNFRAAWRAMRSLGVEALAYACSAALRALT